MAYAAARAKAKAAAAQSAAQPPATQAAKPPAPSSPPIKPKAAPSITTEKPGYREAFQIFDADNDGFISTAELKKTMKTVGAELTDEEVVDVLKESGADHGRISFNDFCRLMNIGQKMRAKMAETDEEDDMRHAFELFDRDRDGRISAMEMKTALASFGVTLSDQNVAELIAEATMDDKVKTVSYDCFKRVMKHGQTA